LTFRKNQVGILQKLPDIVIDQSDIGACHGTAAGSNRNDLIQSDRQCIVRGGIIDGIATAHNGNDAHVRPAQTKLLNEKLVGYDLAAVIGQIDHGFGGIHITAERHVFGLGDLLLKGFIQQAPQGGVIHGGNCSEIDIIAHHGNLQGGKNRIGGSAKIDDMVK
jgi:hypothetical protein